jgi:serine/threonine protein kinase/tetratricopeptide (TPR) repeat protein
MDEEAIFTTALELKSADKRAAYLDEACAGRADLRRKVERLLSAHLRGGSFLDEAAAAWNAQLPLLESTAIEGPGTQIGPYKLLEQIGEGGMGLVFMAEQAQPIRRRVALKILKPGMDTRQVIARFEAERQALALMDHPNIAKVLDGGETSGGRPDFVMDLVNGVPITDCFDQSQLTPRERLELFVSVCQAVQHAHQKGIIHRDIKPTNVLVTVQDGAALVKVIDFGIAKALGQQLTDKTLFTGFAQLIGSPLYMSPEQAALNNIDVDTRSDIYSLSVLLYELLTGTTPFEKERLSQADYEEIRRIIREEEPPKPSTRISTLGQAATTLSTQRKGDPRQLRQLLRGELDWIVMKCLEKDRSRRYETANDLAMDLQRYLEDQPVQACPPSAGYRLRKFVRRHKGKVAVAAAMLALVLAGTVASTWQALRATRAEQRTNEALTEVTAAQAQTRQALDALFEDVVQTMFTKRPQLGEKEKAFLRKVLAFYETFTEQSAESAEATFLGAKAYYNVAHLRALLGEHREAVAGYRQAEASLEQLAAEFPEAAEYRNKLAFTERNMGVELAKLGKLGDAETAFRGAIALRSKLADDFPEDLECRLHLADDYNDFATLRRLQHNYAEAEENFRHVLNIKEKLVAQAGDVPRYRLEHSRALANLADLLRHQEKYEESEKLFRQALKTQEEQIGKGPASARDRQWLADIYSGLGVALAELKRLPEAETAFGRALEIRKKLADDFPAEFERRRELANETNNLASLRTLQGKHAAAEEPYRQALALRKAVVERAGPVPGYRHELAKSYDRVAWVLSLTGRPKEAKSEWRAALELWQKLAVELPQNPDFQAGLGRTLTNLTKLQNQRGELPAAADLLEKARTHHQAALDKRPKDPDFRESYRDFLEALAQNRLGLADHGKVATTADELARFGFEPAKDTYSAACLLARCVTLADKDASLPEAKRKELAQSYMQQVVAMLRQAVTHGFKDVASLNMDADLEPLRPTEEFRSCSPKWRWAAEKSRVGGAALGWPVLYPEGVG